ncbi:ER membrane glycoprotein subunit of the GPI transamidase complex-like protein [Basidiobolus ranarum]|uniref:GPI mannosyltransferase 2 n=1 Tax=Basidiobolus ranarum TaxID=34480 RepID=A0ABR2WER9_9FUNG
MASIFTLHRSSNSTMESNFKRKGPLGLAEHLDTLAKPQAVEFSQTHPQSSTFAFVTKKQNNRILALFVLALFSRFFVWMIAFTSNYFIEDYDSSIDLILPDILTQSSFRILLKKVVTTFVRWDAFYFVHIAEEGYIYEQEYAFFPLLPLLMKGISATVLRPLLIFLDYKSLLVLSGVIISNVSFALATAALYHLSYSIFKKEKFAFISALCFCFTPSCMFMSSMYTESLFALLTFVGMDLYVHKWFWSAAIVWSSSTLTRSNGIVYAGFFIFDLCIKNRSKSIVIYTAQILKAIVLSLLTLLGMVSFQVYGYMNYCVNQSEPRPWCQSRIPLLYSFVQEEYWNCGLFRYYEWKQIPNFLLAAPMVLLSFCGIWSYAAHDWTRFLSLGILTTTPEAGIHVKTQIPEESGVSHSVKTSTGHVRTRNLNQNGHVMFSPVPYIPGSSDPVEGSQLKKNPLEDTFYTEALLPFIYLWGVMLVYCTLFMHIQVITRFFSCMPTVYWFAAHLLVQDIETSKWNRIASRYVLFYFITYGLVGIVLFSNFFPPA